MSDVGTEMEFAAPVNDTTASDVAIASAALFFIFFLCFFEGKMFDFQEELFPPESVERFEPTLPFIVWGQLVSKPKNKARVLCAKT